MAYCRYCGKAISDDSKFCFHCGMGLEMSQGQAQKPQQQASGVSQDAYEAPVIANGGTRHSGFSITHGKLFVGIIVASVAGVVLVSGLATNWYGLSGNRNASDATLSGDGARLSGETNSPLTQTSEDAIRQQIATDFSASPKSNLMQMQTSMTQDELAFMMKLYDDAQGPDGKYPSLRRFFQAICQAVQSGDSHLANHKTDVWSSVLAVFLCKEYVFQDMDINITDVSASRQDTAADADQEVNLIIGNDWCSKMAQCIQEWKDTAQTGGSLSDDAVQGLLADQDKQQEDLQAEMSRLTRQYTSGVLTADEAATQLRNWVRERYEQSAGYGMPTELNVNNVFAQGMQALQEDPDLKSCQSTLYDVSVELYKAQLLQDTTLSEQLSGEIQFLNKCMRVDILNVLMENRNYEVSPRQVAYVYSFNGDGWVISTAGQPASEVARILNMQNLTL